MSTRILIVDDDPVQRRLLDNMVRKFGYDPVVVEGGAAAIEVLLGSKAIDAVVLDLVMRDVDGLEVLAKIREAGLAVPVPVKTVHGGMASPLPGLKDVSLSRDRIEGEAPPVAPLAPGGPASAALALLDANGEVRPLEEIEADTIRFAITHYRGQMSEVARRLRIGRSTLYRKLDVLGLGQRSGAEVSRVVTG